MKEECARIAALGNEQREIVLEIVPYVAVTCVHLVILCDNGVKNRIVAAETVETLLQIFSAIVGVGAVPDGVIEKNLATGHLLDELFDDGLHIGLIGVSIYGRAFGTRNCTVVGTQHDRKIDVSTVVSLQSFCCAHHSRKVVASGHEAQCGDARVTAIVEVGGYSRGILDKRAAHCGRRLCIGTAEARAIGDAVTNEQKIDIGLFVDGVGNILHGTVHLEASERDKGVAVAVVAAAVSSHCCLFNHETDVCVGCSEGDVGRRVTVGRKACKVVLHIFQVSNLCPLTVGKIGSLDDDLCGSVVCRHPITAYHCEDDVRLGLIEMHL